MEEVKKWNKWDKIALTTISSMHLLALMAPFCFSWSAVLVMVLLVHITGLLGINLSYHRNLSHKSFKFSPKWLEYLFAYFAAHALQGDPLFWVSNHRFHHQYTDTERDPHSPNSGFWYSHISWIFDSANIVEKCGKRTNVEDLKNQAFYRWLCRTYFFHPMALAVLLYTLGGFPYIVWGMVRLGFAYDIKLPNETQMQKLAIKT
ncbi:Palmitoyl-monogalactosyldiacylglycerol delta-7 desaturase, chloroplastic [Linum perenne]